MNTTFDAVVIGAGPAGLSCGTTLAAKGLEVAVLDEQASPGGQIYRGISSSTPAQRTLLGEDYAYGLNLVNSFEKAPLHYLSQSRVWHADSAGNVCFSHQGASQKIKAPYIVVCTGAMERPVPFPGWTLPGVITCGGMSNLYKDSGLYPKGPTVLAGSGPLLWLTAEHLLNLGSSVTAILDTTPSSHFISASAEMKQAVKRADFLFKGLKMIAGVYAAARKKKVPIHRNVTDLRAEGGEKLQRLQARSGSRQLNYEIDSLMVTEGILPNTNLQRQIGCDHAWNPVQRYWHPITSPIGRSNLAAVFIAGDGAFVHGAKAAEYKGKLAALAIAREMRRMNSGDYQEETADIRMLLDRDLLPRPLIDRLYKPRKDLYSLKDNTVVCRCEGITAGRIRELIETGYTDHNEIKAIIRCGMGPCQGRMCSSAVHELIAERSGTAPEKLRPHRLRPPIKPVNLSELANANLEDNNEI